MGYFDTIHWSEIKKDLQQGMEKGMAAMRKGAIVAKKKAGELTDEGRRQYRLITLKSKAHSGISDLGARVYALLSGTRRKNPALDKRVKDLVRQIKTLEAQIASLEHARKAPARKKAK